MNISCEQKALLDKHLALVLRKNEHINLTTITNKEDAKILHIEDSLAALPELKDVNGELVDMGSGAGYPGIPLAITTGLKTTLIETIGKKADCLESFIKELNFDAQISVSNKRIEEIASEKSNFYSAATARALASLSSLLELASPLLKINGLLICYKGFDIEDELNSALSICDKLGYKLLSNREYTLSDNKTVHRIVKFKKVKEPDVKLPRKLGFAQKKPFAK